MTFEARERANAELGVRNTECPAPDAEARVVTGSDGSGGADVSVFAEAGASSDSDERSPFCAFVREDGGKCRAMARRPSEYCFWHEPAELAARQAERRGSTPDVPAFEPCELKTGADVYGLLERAALYAAFTAHPDLKRLQTLNVLASTLLRANHVKELEEELNQLRPRAVELQNRAVAMEEGLMRERREKWQVQKDCKKWLDERNKLRSYLRSTGFDPDSLPEKWTTVEGRSVFEHPP